MATDDSEDVTVNWYTFASVVDAKAFMKFLKKLAGRQHITDIGLEIYAHKPEARVMIEVDDHDESFWVAYFEGIAVGWVAALKAEHFRSLARSAIARRASAPRGRAAPPRSSKA